MGWSVLARFGFAPGDVTIEEDVPVLRGCRVTHRAGHVTTGAGASSFVANRDEALERMRELIDDVHGCEAAGVEDETA